MKFSAKIFLLPIIILATNVLYRLKEFLATESCDAMQELNSKFNTTEILANGHYCEIIPSCGLEVKETNGSSCILSF
ncbi:MAG: hypothetical protein Q8R18_01075 [bacterium]|nr:hypothetical protein [bacterium]